MERPLFDAARKGDTGFLAALLDEHPEKLHAREQPYAWTLLHAAAHKGRLGAVDLLLARGTDVAPGFFAGFGRGRQAGVKILPARR